jgi:membrane-associated phospholipid phosphatase
MIAPRRGSPIAPVATATGSVGVLLVVAVVALRTSAGQRLDERARMTVVAGREAELTLLSVLGRVSIGTVLAAALLCVAVALARGHARLAVAAVVVIVGANLTSQILKRLVFERSLLDVIAPNSLPSGHTTVVAAAVGALLLVSPRSLRPLAAAAGAFAVTITGCSTIVAGWHRPSDIVAALAVALAWTAVGSWLVDGSHHQASGVGTAALSGAAAGLLGLVAIGVRPSYGWDGFVEASLVLGVLAVASAVAVAMAERVSPSAA